MLNAQCSYARSINFPFTYSAWKAEYHQYILHMHKFSHNMSVSCVSSPISLKFSLRSEIKVKRELCVFHLDFFFFKKKNIMMKMPMKYEKNHFGVQFRNNALLWKIMRCLNFLILIWHSGIN